MRPEPKLHQLITMLEPWICEQDVSKTKYRYLEDGRREAIRKMTLPDLTSTSRMGDIVCVRNCLIYYFMTRMSGVTSNMLGRYFKRDHSTILHARDNADSMLFINDMTYKRIWHSLDEYIQMSGVQREVDAHNIEWNKEDEYAPAEPVGIDDNELAVALKILRKRVPNRVLHFIEECCREKLKQTKTEPV
jgi:hypothetical protein